MRPRTARRWRNLGRIAGGSALIGGNAYLVGKTFGLGRVASTALIPYKATAGIRFATAFPRIVRAGALSMKAHAGMVGLGGMYTGARLVRRGVQGLRGHAHVFHGNQYVRVSASSVRQKSGTLKRVGRSIGKQYMTSVRQKYGARGVRNVRASLRQKYGRR